jgi:hypothetical protein
MCDVGLQLEDGAHETGQVGIDVDDLLELVEDERNLASALGSELARQLEKPLDGRVEVLRLPPRVEGEAELARVRVDRHDRRDPQPREDAQALASPEERRGEVVVDRLRELLRAVRRGVVMRLRDEDVLAIACSHTKRATTCRSAGQD